MIMPQTLPRITSKTYATVTEMMREQGLDSDDEQCIAEFVEKLISRQRLFQAVDQARRSTAHIPEVELEAIVNDAVDKVEEKYRQKAKNASIAGQ